MTTTNWMDRLSEYLDGTLTPEEHSACDVWLASSAEGRALLQDLRRVVAKAKTLASVPVPEPVWQAISAGIKEQRLGRSNDVVAIESRASERPLSVGRSRRWQFSPLQLAAAAAILLVVGGIAGPRIGTGVVRAIAGRAGSGPENAGEVRLAGYGADASYDKAVQELQVLLERNRSTLDTATVRVLESSLARIEAALAQANEALQKDPGSAYLNDHLSRIKRKKLDVLRQGASLVQAS